MGIWKPCGCHPDPPSTRGYTNTHMSAFKLLFLLFLLVPVVEIYFLVKVGSVIGAWPTILLVIATALTGAFLVRQQGISTLFRLQETLQGTRQSQSQATALALFEGLSILIAGALLLTPGFLTDAMGFICLVPAWRRGLILRFVPSPDDIPMGTRPFHTPQGGSIIEGNFRREDQ